MIEKIIGGISGFIIATISALGTAVSRS